MSKLSQKIELTKKEPDQNYLDEMEIHPGLTTQQANVRGVMAYAFVINFMLQELDRKGILYENWHDPKNCQFTDEGLKKLLQETINKQDYISAGIFSMMLYFRGKLNETN